jgi:hypothetical protein
MLRLRSYNRTAVVSWENPCAAWMGSYTAQPSATEAAAWKGVLNMAAVWTHGWGRRSSVRVRAAKAKEPETEPEREPQLTEEQLKAKTKEWQRKFLLDQAVVSPTVRPSLGALPATCSHVLL